jgi:outer membrane receptor for ferrienterochelin and colicin
MGDLRVRPLLRCASPGNNSSISPARCDGIFGQVETGLPVVSQQGRKASILKLLLCAFSGMAAAEAHADDPAPVKAKEKETIEGQTITVKGRRAQVQRTINSTIYTVKDSAAGQAGSASDVLNTIPSVNTQDGSLTVRGNGNVQLYINGKPAAGRATTLEAMSGGAIASVEVITNPSAKYDANGGAIVNLILKKDADAGVHATLSADAGDHRRGTLAFDGSYGGKDLSADLDVSIQDKVRFTRILNDRTLKTADGVVVGRSIRDADYSPTHSRSIYANGSLLYKLSASSDLGAEFSLSRARPTNRVLEHRIDFDAFGDVSTDYLRRRLGTWLGANEDASVSYQKRGSSEQPSLRIVAQAQRSSVRSDRPFVTTYILPDQPDTAERIYSGTFTRQQRLSIDYDRPLRSGIRMSIGAEFKHDTLRLDNGQTVVPPHTENRAAPPISATFGAARTTGAAYATLEARWQKWTVQAGERGQLLKLDFRGTSGLEPPGRRISGLNHSLSVARDVGSDQLTLKVTRSQQLFELADLNPLTTIVDPDSRSIGNPRLSPQEVTSVEAAYNFGKGSRNGDISFYYRDAEDTLADYTLFLPDNVQVSSKRNYGNARSYGVEANLSDQLTRALKIGVTGNLFHSELPQLNDDGTGQTRSILSYTAQATLDWTPGKADNLHLDANAQGPTLMVQGRKSGSYALNMVWRHTLSPKFTLSLTGQSLLRRSYVRTVLDTPTGRDIGRRLNGGRAVFAGLKYKIGKDAR